jgi:Ca2+-transporting ATPase
VGSGSDVAKSVSDLILLDDNFNTIVSTIEEGKQILSNIKKMFVYLMSNALDELILVGGAIVAGVALPLTAIQIIWVNLFTGSLPAIAFAFDRQQINETDITGRKLYDIRVMFLTIYVAIVISLLLFALYMFLLKQGLDIDLARSIVFASFGTYTLFISFSFLDLSRPLFSYSLVQNKLLILGVLLGLLLMIATFTVPFLYQAFDVSPLPWKWTAFIAVWIIVNIIIVELGKLIVNKFLVK